MDNPPCQLESQLKQKGNPLLDSIHQRNALERGDYKPSLELALKISAVFVVPVEEVFSLSPFPSLSDQLNKD